METWFRILCMSTLFCGKSVTSVAEFVTRHDAEEFVSVYEPIYHPINYRRIYNLRYEPSNRSREITLSLPHSNEIGHSIIKEDGDFVNLTESTAESSAVGVEVCENHTKNTHISDTGLSEDVTESPSTSIMRPDEVTTTKTAQVISEGLRTLLHGTPPYDATIVAGPPVHHNGRGFLSLFEVLKFDNYLCTVSVNDIRMLQGVCYHEFECKSLGGAAMAPCAGGIGVCCVFLQECGDITKQPIGYFQSPNYPTPVKESLVCVLIINIRPKVQQIRLEFLMFELNRPTGGDCVKDQFIISGQNINFIIPVLCGINTGHHVYVDVDYAIENKLFLSVFTKGASPRSFNIKFIQLEDELAPSGCLQYYTESEGMVKSFNYDPLGTIVDGGENNMNYAICIKRNKQMCSVVYTNGVNGEPLTFEIVNKDEEDNDIVPYGQAGAGLFNCPNDYIAINQVRLCGERFNDGAEFDDYTLNSEVRDQSAGPIILPFHSDETYVGQGFFLMYRQEVCL